MEIIWERDALLIGLMVINHHWKSGMWKPVSLDGNEPQMCVHNGVGKITFHLGVILNHTSEFTLIPKDNKETGYCKISQPGSP